MAKKWDGSKVIKEIDAALDRATAQFLTNTRSKLSAASPVLTGRLASSWNIGRNQPDLSYPPERDAPGPIKLKPVNGSSAATCLTPRGLPTTRTTAAGVVVTGSPELRTGSPVIGTPSLYGS